MGKNSVKRICFSFIILCIGLGKGNLLFAQYTPVDQLLNQYVDQNNIDPSDIIDWHVSSEHVSNTSKVRHSYLYQRFNGIEVHNAMLSLHESENGQLLHANNQIIENLISKINVTNPVLSHAQAISAFATIENYDASNFPGELSNIGGTEQKKIFSGGSISEEQINIKLMYVPISNSQVRLAYDFDVLEANSGGDWWSVKIDAVDGALLNKINWTVSCNHLFEGNMVYGKKHKCADHACTSSSNRKQDLSLNPDSYRVYPSPVESPSHGNRTLEVDPADLTASPFGWHDTNGIAGAEFTITRGNNVHAQEDENGNNGTGYAPDGTASLDFDFSIDFTLPPTDNRDAALTNLFYWNNLTHDVWYHYGFDEPAGNFQEHNYGNGGSASDHVRADGLDGDGFNNANMSVPVDGLNPRMQMFLWSAAGSATSTVNSPTDIEGSFQVAPAAFGDENYNITEDIVIADDSSANPTEGCGTFTNAADIDGKIAMIDRGNCQFGLKALNAQNAGAAGVIICNNVAGSIFSMSPGASGGSVNIPVVMMSQEDCDTLKNYIPTPGVDITLEGENNGIDIDGDFDNGIIVHEYGHGISIRLAGGANNSGCLSNTEQMGEGWSDWFGLMMTIDANDVETDLRGIGTYATGEPTNGTGIRTYPYTTDTNVNPFTYADISSVSVPHGVGSVWATMLWDLTWAFIDVHGFDSDLINGTGGNNMVMEIVIEALKLQPCSPGFVDGRDAILDADAALNGGANECLIWETFAARGLGASASQGSAGSVTDGTEAFDTPIECTLQFSKFADVDTIAPGGIINYTIKVVNNSTSDYTNLVVEDSIQNSATYVNGSANLSGSFIANKITWPSTTLNGNDSLEYTFQLQVDSNLVGSIFSQFDDVESANTLWNIESTPLPNEVWMESSSNPFSGSNAWFASNISVFNIQELRLKEEVLLTDTSEFRFFHFYNTELEADGGAISISTDGGSTWDDLGPFITQNAYNSFVFNDPEQPAFSGNSEEYIETVVDLSSFSGSYCLIRYTFFTDVTGNAFGWSVDDINLTNLKVEIRNTASMTSTETGALTASANPVQITAPTCNDGIKNGDETDVDCGGTTCQTCSSCPTNETYSGTQTSTNYQVSDTIASTVIVGAVDSITYQANCIELNVGFEVIVGGEFLGEINPCTPLTGGPIQQRGLVKIIELTVKEDINIATLDIPEAGYYDIKITKYDGTTVTVIQPNTYLEKGPHQITFNMGPIVDDFIYYLDSERSDEN